MKKQKQKKKIKGKKKAVKFEFFYRKTKVCILCKKLRKRNKYKKNKSRADGLEDICKRCTRNRIYTHPSLQFLNKKKKKGSRKKTRRKLEKGYKYFLKRWKKNKKHWKDKFLKPVFDPKKLSVRIDAKPLQVKKKKKKKFSIKKFAKKHGISVKNLKKRLKQKDRVTQLTHQLSVLKLQNKKLKTELKFKKKKHKRIQCLQKGCTKKEWIPKNSKGLTACSKCVIEIMSGKRRDHFVGQTPRNRKKTKLLWKQKQKKFTKKKKKT